MIVDSMTYDEILDLYKHDLLIVNHKMDDVVKVFTKAMKNSRSKERQYYKPVRFTSARGFNYVLQYFNRGIEYPTKQRLGVFFYAWFRKDRGIYAISYSQLNREALHFTIYHPHFFDRYRERFLKDATVSKPDVIHTFMINNLKRPSLCYPSAKYPTGYWMVCNDGLCLCNRIHDLFIEAKTFITWDMTGQDQKEAGLKGKALALEKGFDINIPEEDFDDYELDEP